MAAVTWRDLADQLTVNQVEQIESLAEREEPSAMLLAVARELASQNLAGSFYADVPEPAGAVSIGPWMDEGKTTIRDFDGTERAITPDMDISICGTQANDGQIVRRYAIINQGWDPEQLDSATLRRLAAALVDTAAELDRLSA